MDLEKVESRAARAHLLAYAHPLSFFSLSLTLTHLQPSMTVADFYQDIDTNNTDLHLLSHPQTGEH